jgi:hypothetical protein
VPAATTRMASAAGMATTAEMATAAVLRPLLKQNMHCLRIVAHHIGVSLELGFLSGGDMKLLAKVRYPSLD